MAGLMQLPARVITVTGLVIATLVTVGWLGVPGSVVADPAIGLPVSVCDSLRLKDKCRTGPLSVEDGMPEKSIRVEGVKIDRTVPLGQMKFGVDACEVEFEVSYAQMNDRVKVETNIANASCPASHGEFALRIRTKTASGEVRDRTFPQTWARADGADVVATQFFPMEDATDLVSVRVRSRANTACVCD